MSWQVFLAWIESHPGLSSWVQAFGSIAAILVAVFIAGRDARLRRKAENDSRRAAIDRAIIAVNDAGMRVAGALNTIDGVGVRRDVMGLIASDLAQSEQHLKEVLSIQGVDSAIYSQIFKARVSVETAAHNFYVLRSAVDPEDFDLQTAKSALQDITSAYDALELMKKKA